MQRALCVLIAAHVLATSGLAVADTDKDPDKPDSTDTPDKAHKPKKKKKPKKDKTDKADKPDPSDADDQKSDKPDKKDKKHKKDKRHDADDAGTDTKVELDATTPDATDSTAAPIPVVITPPAAGAPVVGARPVVTPQHVFELHGALPIAPAGGSVGIGFELGGTYGVADKLEIGADYALSLKAFDATGTLTARGAYLAKSSASWDFALAGALIADLTAGGEVSLDVGAWFRYHLGPSATLFTGTPGLPPFVAGPAGFPRPPSPYQLTLGVDNGNRLAINLPIGLGYQASPSLYVYGTTTLAYFLFDATEQRFLFADVIPIGVGVYDSVSPALDVGVQVSDDLKNAGNSYVVLLSGRYFIK